ncbi:MAG: hypothetical protein JSS67_11725 [Bacteroidetes bacterium]|nr:hypothetical protein [Bacteroidota bacterium]
MKKFRFLLIYIPTIFFITIQVNGQGTAQDYVGGYPIYGTDRFKMGSDITIEGDFTIPKTFTPANIYLSKTSYIPSIPSYFNLIFHVFIYKDENGVEKYPDKILPRIAFLDDKGKEKTVFKSGFPFVDSLDGSTYYEMLDSGKITLLKYYSCYFLDNKEPFSNRMTRTYHVAENYFALMPNDKMIKLKLSKDDIMALFNDKQAVMETFMQKNKTKFKKESDLIELVHFYNNQ